jgi:hypothetical protein
MPQLILLTGTIIAASIGFALVALILRNTIRKSRALDNSSEIQTVDFTDVDPNWAAKDLAVRGYDTPELWREDMLTRHRGRSAEKRLH